MKNVNISKCRCVLGQTHLTLKDLNLSFFGTSQMLQLMPLHSCRVHVVNSCFQRAATSTGDVLCSTYWSTYGFVAVKSELKWELPSDMLDEVFQSQASLTYTYTTKGSASVSLSLVLGSSTKKMSQFLNKYHMTF